MAGCDAHNNGGDNGAAKKRVASWAALGAIIAGVWMLLTVAGGPVGLTLLASALAAIAGAGLGFFIGSAYDWFTRLKTQDPDTITMSGKVDCAGKNPFGLQPWTDGDWTCNLGDLRFHTPSDLVVTAPGAVSQVDEVRLRAAPHSGLDHAYPSYNEEAHITDILHCEISSHIGGYGVVGGGIGAVSGAASGTAAGVAACIAAGIFTFGLGALLCTLIVAAAAAAGAWAGGVAGEAVGAGVGWVVDELSDFDKLGKTIEAGGDCTLFITGTWVTDTSHQHNEIHNIEAVQVVCDIQVNDPPLHTNLVAATLIGREPAGGGAPK